MSRSSILAICASLQASSSNLNLLRELATLLPDGVDYEISDVLRDIPPFNPDVEALGFPEPVATWKAQIAAADGLIVACPEYVFAVPGSLKNALDWLVGSMEMDNKPVAITASVPHAGRGNSALKSLAHTLGVMGAVVVGGTPIARDDGESDALRTLVDDLLAAIAAAPPRADGSRDPGVTSGGR